MSSATFGDLDIEYVTSNFKELISTIETAKEELASGM